MRHSTREILNGEDRAKFGAIVSCSNDRGEHLAFHALGTEVEAVRQCCTLIDRHAADGPWFVDAISTPQTIYHDLVRKSRGGRGTFYRERQLLSRIGRLDLMRVPHLVTTDPSKRSGHAWRRKARAGYVSRKKGRKT